MRKLLFIWVLSFASLAHSQSLSVKESKFLVDGKPLYTVNAVIAAANEQYPEAKTFKTKVEKVVYNGETYKGLEVVTEGLVKGSKVEQKLTYILIHDGLWRMLYVESNVCYLAQALKEGETGTDWICETSDFPLSKVFTHLFLLDREGVNINTLSQSWGKKIILRSELPPEPLKEEKVLSLGDIKKVVIKHGGTWEVEDSVWRGFGSDDAEQAAIRILVKTQLDGYKISQSFLYVPNGSYLHLKEIDGVFCRYVERVNKEICDNAHEAAYAPTQVTPFKVKLTNSYELTPVDKKEISKSKVKFSCGNVALSYEKALRYHFNYSTFAIRDVQTHKEALRRLASTVDPEGVFIGDNPEFSFSDEEVESLFKNILLGEDGECEQVANKLKEMQTEILKSSSQLNLFLKAVKKYVNQETKEIEVSSDHKGFLRLLRKLQYKNLKEKAPLASIDVAAANLQKYFKKALNLTSGFEQALIAAYVDLDEYSNLLDEPMTQTKNVQIKEVGGSSDSIYFGVTVVKGESGYYILRLHPSVAETSALQVGDKVMEVNDVRAHELSEKALDEALLNRSKPLALRIKRLPDDPINLNAKPLDMMELFYSLEVLNTFSGQVYVHIKIKEFYAGLAKSLRPKLLSIFESYKVAGVVLDLKDNPGGHVDEALSVANFFIKKGVLSYYRFGPRGLGKFKTLMAKKEVLIDDQVPIVTIVNEDTASSAEILAATLKAHKKGLIIGSKTFGKHVAQSYLPVKMSDGRALSMLVTSTEYFDPNGLSLNGYGVDVDVELFSALISSEGFDDRNGPGENLNVESLVSDDSRLVVLEKARAASDSYSVRAGVTSLGVALFTLKTFQKY